MSEKAGSRVPIDMAAVNAASKQGKSNRLFAFIALFILAISSVGGWLWLNREQEPYTLTIGAGPFGSDAFNLLSEVRQVVLRHSDELRLNIKSTRDGSQNIALLNKGEIDAAVIRSDTPVVADVRGVAELYPDVFQIIVRDDAPAFTVTDLTNIQISVPEYGSDGFRSFWVIGDHYDLPIDQMRWKAEPFNIGAKKLLSGQIDALFTVRSLRDMPLIRLFEDAQLKSIKLRYLPIAQAEAIALKRPFLTTANIPKGAFTGATPVPGHDTPTSAVKRILVTRADVDPEAIRELTRIMFENRLDLTIRFALASAISAPDETRGLSVPLHEGAQAFYNRDQPSFVQENAEPLALGVTVLTLLLSGLFALRSRFVSSQKNKADIYNYQLLDIQKQAMLADEADELDLLKVDLSNILQTVVIALDTDEVTDESFQSFSLLWDAVRETINDRYRQIKT
ncbi:TAXI family TRAP transporter solute-binding subunit [Ahrensia sp. 13_GOM-1096m]|uniref:TAXI family TRAP transporter solute-binding subunit n=1 Tax=Ahrensia sp. 13_GOM-1096m TaxID=1380380 RepID=UPI00047EDFCB|nr:TAXI family TRAP transporter solute-binding subunit [Ahrensia sp. 13_GOM-1096m]